MTTRIGLGLTLAFAIGVSTGCGDEETGCITGESAPCACVSGAIGAQVCRPDGTFGACECDRPPRDSGDGRPRDAGPMPDAREDWDSGFHCGGDGCDVFPQSGCGAGHGCYLGTTGGTCEAAGSVAEGMPCTTASDCQPGFTCHGSVCRQHCCAASFECPTGQVCASLGSGTYVISVCRPDMGDDAGPGAPDAGAMCSGGGVCDLVTQTGCGGGEGCYLGAMSAICAPAGTAGDGSSCMNTNDCQEGFHCHDEVCRHYCCRGWDIGCPTGQTCAIDLLGGSPPAPTGVGLCRLP